MDWNERALFVLDNQDLLTSAATETDFLKSALLQGTAQSENFETIDLSEILPCSGRSCAGMVYSIMKTKNIFLLVAIVAGLIGFTGGFGNEMIMGVAKAFAGVFFILFFVIHVFVGPQMGNDPTAKGRH